MRGPGHHLAISGYQLSRPALQTSNTHNTHTVHTVHIVHTVHTAHGSRGLTFETGSQMVQLRLLITDYGITLISTIYTADIMIMMIQMSFLISEH